MPLQNLGIVQLGPPVFLRCAQPDRRGFEDLSALGVRIVYKLNADGVSVDEENALVVGHPLIRFRPLNPILRLHVREDVYGIVREIQADLDAGRGVAVHCTHGRDRTGQVVATWRVVVQGWPVERAKSEWAEYGGGVLSRIFDSPDFELLEAIAAERAA